jgi:hypothetical protein
MKYLHAGNQCSERLQRLINLSSIRSEAIISGLDSHLVTGHTIESAAALTGNSTANLARAVETLEVVATQVEAIKDIDWEHFKGRT